MTPFVFDTLSASKQLREAGMSEGVAEAVVSVFQHAATMPDVSHLATKADLDALSLATKADLDALSLATKADLEALSLATRTDLGALKADLATKASKTDLEALRLEMKAEFATVRAELHDKLRQQMWTFIGGVGVLLTISTAMTRVLAG